VHDLTDEGAASMRRHEIARPGSSRVPHPTQLPHPSGPVVGRFRSVTLDWTDPESGQRLRGHVEAPDGYLAQLATQGLRVGSGFSPQDRLAGSACARGAPGVGTFWVRVSPGRAFPGRRNGV